MPISLRQLLSLGHLPGHSVLAGASGLSAAVRAVVPGTTVRALKEPAEGRLVIFADGQLPLDGPNADLAIRFCVSSGVVGLITNPPKHPVALSTLRLADKYGIALITAESVDQAATVTALETDVRAPEVAGAHRLTAVVRQLSPRSSAAPQVLAVLRGELGLPLALLDSEGHRVEGDESVDWAQLTSALKNVLDSSHPAERVHGTPDGGQLILHPIVLPTSRHAGLWFAAIVGADNAAMADPARHCLAIGAWGFTTHLATRSLMTEVEGRQRALLLDEILGNAESPSRQTAERATVLGWRLSGWHTVVHLATASGTPSATPAGFAADLEVALAAAGITAPVVERPDGWMLWITEEIALDSADQEKLARAVRQALLSIESEHDGLRMCAGVGLARAGIHRAGKLAS